MRTKQVGGRSSIAHEAGVIEAHRGPWGRHGGSRRFFGLDVEEMSSRAQVVAALAVLAPVVLSELFLVVFVPGLWWIFTTYGWIAFPAFGLLLRGLAGSSGNKARRDTRRVSAKDRERELLEALAREGELTPVLAAVETSFSVAEADAMLKELAEGGHLDVRVRGGTLVYALWGHAPLRRVLPGDWESEVEGEEGAV